MLNNFDELTNKFVNDLTLVKEEFIKDKQELAVSIRKDVIAVQLKELLNSNTDYYNLKSALEMYIQNLYKLNKEESNEDK